VVWEKRYEGKKQEFVVKGTLKGDTQTFVLGRNGLDKKSRKSEKRKRGKGRMLGHHGSTRNGERKE